MPQTRRIAVVTGAGSGIGAGVALALGEAGWAVVLAGRRREALAAVARKGDELPGLLDPVPTDVTDEPSVRALFDAVVERHRRLDLLVNNAGRNAPARELDRTDEVDRAGRPQVRHRLRAD